LIGTIISSGNPAWRRAWSDAPIKLDKDPKQFNILKSFEICLNQFGGFYLPEWLVEFWVIQLLSPSIVRTAGEAFSAAKPHLLTFFMA